MRKFIGAIFFGALIFGSNVWAGVVADLKLVQSKPEQPQRSWTGKYILEGRRYRIDFHKSGNMSESSAIFDQDKHSLVMLIHERRQYIRSTVDDKDMKAQSAQGAIPEIEEMRKRGFDVKEVGHETIEGFQCAIYEIRDVKGTSGMQGKAWVSKELGQIPLRMHASFADGLKTQVNLENVKRTTVAASQFEIPKGYTELPDPRKQLEGK